MQTKGGWATPVHPKFATDLSPPSGAGVNSLCSRGTRKEREATMFSATSVYTRKLLSTARRKYSWQSTVLSSTSCNTDTQLIVNKATVHSRLHPSVRNSQWVLAGLCRSAKFGENLGCYACRVLLSLIRNRLHATRHGAIMWKHDVIQHSLKPKFHDSGFLVASSWHPCRHARQARLVAYILARIFAHKNLVKVGGVVSSHLSRQTDIHINRKTNRHTIITILWTTTC